MIRRICPNGHLTPYLGYSVYKQASGYTEHLIPSRKQKKLRSRKEEGIRCFAPPIEVLNIMGCVAKKRGSVLG